MAFNNQPELQARDNQGAEAVPRPELEPDYIVIRRSPGWRAARPANGNLPHGDAGNTSTQSHPAEEPRRP